MNENLFQAAVERWGPAAQMVLTMEECGELSVSLAHFIRGRATTEQVAEEIADVEIMTGQLRAIFGDALVDAAKARKLTRLEELLSREEVGI